MNNNITIDIGENTTRILVELSNKDNHTHQDYWECECEQDIDRIHNEDGSDNECKKCDTHRIEGTWPAKVQFVINYIYNTMETY